MMAAASALLMQAVFALQGSTFAFSPHTKNPPRSEVEGNAHHGML